MTNCPECEREMVVPQVGILPSNLGRPSWEPFESSAAEVDQGLFDPPEPAAEAAQQEVQRLRAQLKKALEEGERVKSSAMHAKAEIKSFHSDRQHLKSELSQARLRVVTVEGQAAALATALEDAEEENASLRSQYDNDLAVSRERLAAMETQLDVRERELTTVQAINAGLGESLAAVEAELATLHAEKAGLLAELGTAQQLLNEAAEIEDRSEGVRQSLVAQWEEASLENQQLSEARDQLTAQVEALRHDLLQTDGGPELLDLRNRVDAAAVEQARLVAALTEKTVEAQALVATDQTLTAELAESRRLHAEAEHLAAANSEATLKKDNAVLRGIIARQNVDLGVHHVEVRRLRRARFGLRILYVLFAIGLLGVFSLALNIFTNHSVDEIIPLIFR